MSSAAATAVPRALRPLPFRKGGRMRARFAVMINGEKVGEVRQVKTRRIVGYGIGNCPWFADYEGRGLDVYSRREQAAKAVYKAWERDRGEWEFSLTYAVEDGPDETRTFTSREERTDFYNGLGGAGAVHKGTLRVKFAERLVDLPGFGS